MRRFWSAALLAACSLFAFNTSADAAIVIAGSFQGWTPPSGVVMSDQGGGIFTGTITGLTSGTNYNFKILDSGANPTANWGDPEWTPSDNWFVGDTDGTVTIRLNTNIGSTGSNNTNVGNDSTSWTPQLVGDFMNESGGLADWTPNDPFFSMTPSGGNNFAKSLVVSAPGTYQVKLTDGTGWDRQFGSDGYNSNAGSFNFTTTVANQQVDFAFNSFNATFSVVAVPEPASMTLVAMTGAVALVRRRWSKKRA